MATPVGHAIAGFAVAGFSKSPHTGSWISLILLCGVVGALPDIDVIPGILIGTPAQYHQGITHSLGFALAVSGAIAGVYKIGGKPFKSIFLLCLVAYMSHLVIDMLGSDGRPPIGIPIFWPISDATFISPKPILWGVQHASSSSTQTSEWIKALFSIRNFAALLMEVMIALPFIHLGRLMGRGPQLRKSDELPKGQN